MKQAEIDAMLEGRKSKAEAALAKLDDIVSDHIAKGTATPLEKMFSDAASTAERLSFARTIAMLEAPDDLSDEEKDILMWASVRLDADMSDLLDTEHDLPAGDYIVTDPCYLVRNGDWGCDAVFAGGDWGKPRENLALLGIPNSHMRNTLFGDWSCALIDLHTDEKVGTFCADAGMVVVAKLDEVEKYNPDWNETLPRFCYAILPNFEGKLHYDVTREVDGKYEFYTLTLRFHGRNADTGVPMHLIGGMFDIE